MEVFAVYPGRFHPFHKGHASSFNQLADQFGMEHTLLAISGKQEQPKSPFSVVDRAKMAMVLGIPKENIISINQPYKAEEYIKYVEDKGLDPKDFALVFAVSKKDMEGVPEMGIPPDPRFTFKPKRDGSPAYLQPYSGNENSLQNMLQHAYVVSTDVAEFPIAGETMRDASAIRTAYKTGDEQKRKEILHDLYGKHSKHIKPIFDRELLQSEPSLKEFYERIKPLLKEASIPKRVEMLKRLLEKRRRKGKRGVKVGRSITTGWWGGLGNDSGEGGGEGVAEDVISEIGYAQEMSESKIPDEQFIKEGTKVDEIDHHTVWHWEGKGAYKGNHAYFFADSNDAPTRVLCRIGFADYGNRLELTSLRNPSGVRGAITALCIFVAKKLNKPFLLPDTEPLTKNGIDWLCSLIRDRGRGLKLSDQNGNFPDSDAIRQEWINAKYNGGHGETSIMFEDNGTKLSSETKIKRIDETYQWLEQSLYSDNKRVVEASSPAQQAAIAINMKKAGKVPKKVDEAVVDYLDETTK